MESISFIDPNGVKTYGSMTGDTVRDAGATLRSNYADLRAVLAAGAMAELDGVGAESDVASVTLLPPIPNPDKLLCIGLNYMAHIKETGRDKPKYPAIFIRHPSSRSVMAPRWSAPRPAKILITKGNWRL